MAMWADNVKFVKDIIDSKYQKIDTAITEVITIFCMIGITKLKLCVKHSNLNGFLCGGMLLKIFLYVGCFVSCFAKHAAFQLLIEDRKKIFFHELIFYQLNDSIEGLTKDSSCHKSKEHLNNSLRTLELVQPAEIQTLMDTILSVSYLFTFYMSFAFTNFLKNKKFLILCLLNIPENDHQGMLQGNLSYLSVHTTVYIYIFYKFCFCE